MHTCVYVMCAYVCLCDAVDQSYSNSLFIINQCDCSLTVIHYDTTTVLIFVIDNIQIM